MSHKALMRVGTVQGSLGEGWRKGLGGLYFGVLRGLFFLSASILGVRHKGFVSKESDLSPKGCTISLFSFLFSSLSPLSLSLCQFLLSLSVCLSLSLYLFSLASLLFCSLLFSPSPLLFCPASLLAVYCCATAH